MFRKPINAHPGSNANQIVIFFSHANVFAAFVCIYILLSKHEGLTGRISARGLDSTDRAQRGPHKKDPGPIFSQDGPEKAYLIRDLLHDCDVDLSLSRQD